MWWRNEGGGAPVTPRTSVSAGCLSRPAHAAIFLGYAGPGRIRGRAPPWTFRPHARPSGATRLPAMADFDENGLDAATDFFRRYRKPLGIAAGAIAVALGGTALWQQSERTKLENAEKAFFQAQLSASQGNPQLAVADLEKVATRYAGTNAGDRAALVVAQLLLDQGKVQDAVTRLEGLRKAGGEKRLGSTLPSVLGAAYENLNKPAQAAAEYEKAAAASASASEQQQRRADAARAWLAAGQAAKAKEIWAALAKDERGLLAQEARVRLGELEFAR